MKISIPETALVVLVGPTGAGKSTFAARHFRPTEVISSDYCRSIVADDENDQSATADAFAVLHYIASKRLAAKRLTVIDATSVRKEDRRELIRLGRQNHALITAIVFNVPEAVCRERNRTRENRQFGDHVIRNQSRLLRQSLRGIDREGFQYVHRLSSPEEVDAVEIERQKLWNDRKDEHGPFDLIGDVHGCFDELVALLEKLDYQVQKTDDGGYEVSHPEGRKAVFLGDLVDRGPGVAEVLRLVMDMVDGGSAICVPGNHESKLLRALKGSRVQVTHGLAESLEQLKTHSEDFVERVKTFLNSLVSHYELDNGRLVIAHAGMKEELQGRTSRTVREFALYGETTGETDEFGLPVRYNWAQDYRGSATVVYGHTPVPTPEWLNNTICLDTGCVFGGSLTALRYPERELVSVPAAKVYYEPVKPLVPESENESSADAGLSAQQRQDEMLDISDFLGKRFIQTSLAGRVGVSAEHSAAALEVLSRFSVNPKWLIYLPGTMSPAKTSQRDSLLEHPAEALEYFRENGVARVIAEEKHMGSRAVVVICRDADAARQRFGVVGAESGVIYTRTGRRFFDDRELETKVIDRLRNAVGNAGLWDRLETDWLCLDCEIMPWSMKAGGLISGQYGPVAESAAHTLPAAAEYVKRTAERGVDTGELSDRWSSRVAMADAYAAEVERYSPPASTIDDLRIAPFQLMASEGAVHNDKPHRWHMDTIGEITDCDKQLLVRTSYLETDLSDEAACEALYDWWEQLTAAGGEGIVVKPEMPVVSGDNTLVQPALKCRGREYLRIIYGPEYTEPGNLARLKSSRRLGRKRSLAAREFGLGIEALERFVKQESLRRVHECAAAVLALESQPVDPRL